MYKKKTKPKMILKNQTSKQAKQNNNIEQRNKKKPK